MNKVTIPQEILDYLNDLCDGDPDNVLRPIMDVREYIRKNFNLSMQEAIDVLVEWIWTYGYDAEQ